MNLFFRLGLYGGHLAMLAVLVELEMKKRDADTVIFKTLCRSLITRKPNKFHLVENPSVLTESNQ